MMRRTTLTAMGIAATLLPWNSAVAQQPPPLKPALPLEYAVKFVCTLKDEGGSAAFAPGTYYTAINVHNPRESARMMVKVVAARNEQPSSSTPFTPMGMRYDQALELTCRSIARLMEVGGQPVPAGTFSGFVVIQSGSELDVVAVYTAGQGAGRPVVTLETERVPMRRVE